MRRGARALAVLLLAALALAGCGGSGGSGTTGSTGTATGRGAHSGGGRPATEHGTPQLLVAGAASLTRAFTAYARSFHAAHVRLSFGGSDALAAQISQGLRPDVFAAANVEVEQELHASGLVEPPVVFASNRLVVAVPAHASKVRSLADLARHGVTIAMGAGDVPIGAYARAALIRLGGREERAILANVRSTEPDVNGIVGKLTQGAVDAGFLYETDVRATGGRLRAIALPESLQPSIAYSVTVVTGTHHPAEARAFVAGLLHGAGAAALRRAGFQAPPR